MKSNPQQDRHWRIAMTVISSPIVLAFLIGALPVLLPAYLARELSRLIGRHSHTRP